MELIEAKNAALSYLKPASRELLKYFRSDVTVHEKPDGSPVTIADKNAENILRKRITRDFPGHGIIGEEFGNESPTAEWVWTIDPIDGTLSFIRGLPFFSILLALLHRGQPVMGVICFPALGETAWAVKDKGAHYGRRRIKVSQCNNLKTAVVATGDRYCFKEKKCLHLYNQLYKCTSLVRTYPDAFGHLMAICGAVDVMVDPWAYIWDFAPCKILAEEAGGRFANFTGNRGSITEGTAIVGNSKLVQQVRTLYLKEKKSGKRGVQRKR